MKTIGMEVPSLPGSHVFTSAAMRENASAALRRAGWSTARTGKDYGHLLRLSGQTARWAHDGQPLRFVSRSRLFGQTGTADAATVERFAQQAHETARECQAALIAAGYLCTPPAPLRDPAGNIDGYQFHIARYIHPAERKRMITPTDDTLNAADAAQLAAPCRLLLAAAAGKPQNAAPIWETIVANYGRAAAWTALVDVIQQDQGLTYQEAVAHAHLTIEATRTPAPSGRDRAVGRYMVASILEGLRHDFGALTIDAVTFFHGKRDAKEMLALAFDPTDANEYHVIHHVLGSDIHKTLTYRSALDARDEYADQIRARIYK